VQQRQERQIDKSREVSWYEHLLVLLQIGASIEHALMVQYLYAAYSLRDDVEQVRRWREILLLIAREEMGHLLTVQNILALLGGPINIDREDYPVHTPFQAFPFQLERLTRGSLACYCYAEMPVGLDKDPDRAEEYAAIRADAKKHVEQQGENFGGESKRGRRGQSQTRRGALPPDRRDSRRSQEDPGLLLCRRRFRPSELG